jgi:hypothetical protein
MVYHGSVSGKDKQAASLRFGLVLPLSSGVRPLRQIIVVKFLYLGFPFVIGVALAIAVYQILSGRKLTLFWIKYPIFMALILFSLIFLGLPQWHRRTEAEGILSMKTIHDEVIRPTIIHKLAPLLGIVAGLVAYSSKK